MKKKHYQKFKLQDFYRYKATIVRVVDADTVDAIIDLGFGINVDRRFRIADFDAPETWRPRNDLENEHGTKATQRAIELLVDKDLVFITSKRAGIYGRYGAQIFLEDGRDYAKVMIQEGYQKRETY